MTRGNALALAALAGLVLLGACSKEVRVLGSEQPQTPPHGEADPRDAQFGGNAYQIAQGGRYFTWYGCDGCHASGATGVLDLSDNRWKNGSALDEVYHSIAHHPGAPADYGKQIPVEQLWEMTAYVRGLRKLSSGQRARQDADERGEPQWRYWSGAIR